MRNIKFICASMLTSFITTAATAQSPQTCTEVTLPPAVDEGFVYAGATTDGCDGVGGSGAGKTDQATADNGSISIMATTYGTVTLGKFVYIKASATKKFAPQATSEAVLEPHWSKAVNDRILAADAACTALGGTPVSCNAAASTYNFSASDLTPPGIASVDNNGAGYAGRGCKAPIAPVNALIPTPSPGL